MLQCKSLSVFFVDLFSVWAPSSASSGTCGVRKLKNPKLFASVNKKLKSNGCGWCVFIYCPSFSGCSGSPMKVEVVSEHEGSGDFALSPDAFKIATGKGLSKRDREALYKSTTRFVSC